MWCHVTLCDVMWWGSYRSVGCTCHCGREGSPSFFPHAQSQLDYITQYTSVCMWRGEKTTKTSNYISPFTSPLSFPPSLLSSLSLSLSPSFPPFLSPSLPPSLPLPPPPSPFTHLVPPQIISSLPTRAQPTLLLGQGALPKGRISVICHESGRRIVRVMFRATDYVILFRAGLGIMWPCLEQDLGSCNLV